MGRVITTREAQLKTVSVEIKAVSVNGKQMTLSMFRQLKEEQIVSEDLTLKGIPWGTVNYFSGECAKAPEHLHVVWQKGSELRRTCVSERLTYRDMILRISVSSPGMEEIAEEALWIYEETSQEKYLVFLNRYEDLYRDLENLDQLFIAV